MANLQTIQWENAVRVIEPGVTASGVHVSPLDPSFPLDVRFLRLRPPACAVLRRHDYFELAYLKTGSAVYWVKDREVVVNQGDLFVMGRDLYHGIREYISPSIGIVALFFHADVILGDDMVGENAEYLIPFEIQGVTFPHVIRASTGVPLQVLAMLNRIYQEKMSPAKHSPLAMKTYLKMILVLLISHYAEDQCTSRMVGRKSRDLDRLQPLFDYMDRHLVETITVERAASLLNMSKSHFMKVFRGATGSAFVSHLNRLRVCRAQQLIAGTSRSIAAISQDVGFCDQSYFGVVFRRIVGVSPRDYRNRLSAA